jgi:hypothetical protein
MGWFRSNRRIGGGLALIALVVHLVLSFGHVHVATSGNAVGAALASAERAVSAPEAPVQPLAHPGLADGCAICANIHLAVSLLVAWSAWLLPLNAEQELTGSIGDTKRPLWLGTAVQARAPPIA